MHRPHGVLYISLREANFSHTIRFGRKAERRKEYEKQGRSEEAARQIGLQGLQNRPEKSWNEVNSMPTDRDDFGDISGQIRPNGMQGAS